MILLHNVGPRINSNYNTLEEILETEEPLSFDGVYRSVYENAHSLRDKDVTLFVMGNYVGGDNSFDVGQPREKLCSWKEIVEMATDYGFKIGWHTWSHKDLTTLTDEEIVKEVTPPFPMESFAYPYGRFDERVIGIVRSAGFERAYSVTDGDNTPLQLCRRYLNHQ